MKKIIIEIRKGIKDIDDTDGIILRIADTKDFIVVENDSVTFGDKDIFHVRFSSMWFVLKAMFRYFFTRKREIEFRLKDTEWKILLDKYLLDIFYGLEELGVASRKEFYYSLRDLIDIHPAEPSGLGDELMRLNRDKFAKYLMRHIQ